MWSIAYSDAKLHEAELAVVRQASCVFAVTDQEVEQLRNEGRVMAGL